MNKELVVRKDFFSDMTLIEFLELDTRSPELLNQGLNLVGRHTDARPIYDMQYWQEKNVLFVSTGESASLLAKTGGLFSFGKKKEPTKAAGSLVSMINGKKGPGDIGEYNFEKGWCMDFPVPSGPIDWSESTSTLYCGEDSGSIHCISVDADNLIKYSCPTMIKVHASRINKLYYDEGKKTVYSIGDDRKFKETSIEKKKILNEFEVSGKRPNCMFVEKDLRVAYVGDGDGNVKLIDLNRNPPSCINNIKANTKDSVSSIYVRNNLIFCACAETGKIPVYHLEDPKNSSSQAVLKYTFQAYPGVSCIRYWKEKGLLFVGHLNGTLAVFCKYISIAFPFCRLF